MIPGILDGRGDLRWVDGEKTIPFGIKRVFYMTGMPAGAMRGGHAHRLCHQFLISLAGHLDAKLCYGNGNRCHTRLNNPTVGLHVPPMVWCELCGFSEGSVCLALASEHYDESDYIRDFDLFLKEVRQ